MTPCELEMKGKTLKIWYSWNLALWHHMAQFEKHSFNRFFYELCPQGFTHNDLCNLEMKVMITKSWYRQYLIFSGIQWQTLKSLALIGFFLNHVHEVLHIMTPCDLEMKVKTIKICYNRHLGLWHHMAQFEKHSLNTFLGFMCTRFYT